MNSNIIGQKSFDFAVRIVKLSNWLDNQPGVARTLSKQILRSGTSIGANVAESQSAQSIRFARVQSSEFRVQSCLEGGLYLYQTVFVLKDEACTLIQNSEFRILNFKRSTKDFIHKLEIALKEARETEYWLKLLVASEVVSQTKLQLLLKDVDELIRILVSILKTKKQNL